MMKSISIFGLLGIAFLAISTGTVSAQALSINVTTNNETCSASNGSITATGNGGNSPYVYSLDGSTYQVSGNFTGLISGNYTVYVTAESVAQVVRNFHRIFHLFSPYR